MTADLERLRTVRHYGKAGFAGAVRSLVPRGAIWELRDYFEGPIQTDEPRRTWLGGLLWAFSDEAAKLEENLLALPVEAVPGLADWLLSDWEKALGLPDAFAPAPATDDERRAIAHAKYTTKNEDMSAAFYIDLAASYGSTIIVVDQAAGVPFRVDIGRVDRTNGDIDAARLNSALSSPSYWRIEISASDPNKERLAALFQRLKPAHTILLIKEV